MTNIRLEVVKHNYTIEPKWVIASNDKFRVLLDEPMVRHFELNEDMKFIEIDEHLFNINTIGIFHSTLRLKGTKVLFHDIETLKKNLLKGVNLNDLIQWVRSSSLDYSLWSGKYGPFMTIGFPLKYQDYDSQSVKIYLGHSLKNAGINCISCQLFLDEKDRIKAMGFISDVRSEIFYRFYLTKEKKYFKSMLCK